MDEYKQVQLQGGQRGGRGRGRGQGEGGRGKGEGGRDLQEPSPVLGPGIACWRLLQRCQLLRLLHCWHAATLPTLCALPPCLLTYWGEPKGSLTSPLPAQFTG